jgi:hypothetical protein
MPSDRARAMWGICACRGCIKSVVPGETRCAACRSPAIPESHKHCGLCGRPHHNRRACAWCPPLPFDPATTRRLKHA